MSDQSPEQDAATEKDPEAGATPVRQRPFFAKAVWWFAAIFAGGVLVAPFFFTHPERTAEGRVWNVVVTHDLPNQFRFMEYFDRSLKSGVIQPRWFADINKGYGNPTFDFYPRNLYYITAVVHLLARDWVYTMFVVCVLALAGSGLALYKLSRVFHGKQASLLAAIVYLVLPIHMIDLYCRGDLGQFVAYVFLPLELYFAYRVGREGRARDYAGLGLVFGLHLLTHLPTGYLFTFALVVYALLWAAKAGDWRIFYRVARGMAVGLLLSATYWVPAVVYAKDTVATSYGAASSYHHQYVSLLPTNDLFNTLIAGSFYFNVFALIAAIATLRYLRQPAERIKEGVPASNRAAVPDRAELQTRLWVILCGAAIFMSTSYSYYISALVPKIRIANSPSRWLTISCLFMSLLVAACVERIKDSIKVESRRALALGLVLCAALALNVWLSVKDTLIGSISLPGSRRPAGTVGVLEDSFLPRDATPAKDLSDTPLVVAQPEETGTEVLRWNPEDRLVFVNANVPATIRLKTYYFPGWAATVDGQPTPLLRDHDGVQLVNVAPGIHQVQVSYATTFPRGLANAASVAGLLFIIGLSFEGSFGALKKLVPSKSPDRQSAETASTAITEVAPKVYRRSPATRWLVLVGLAFGVAMLIFLIGRFGSRNRPSDGSDNTPRDVRRSAADRSAGAEVRVFLPGRDSVPIAVDEKSLSDLLNALSARSNDLSEMVESRRVFVVPNNTKVRILNLQSGSVRIRILEGNDTMSEGLVPERWVY